MKTNRAPKHLSISVPSAMVGAIVTKTTPEPSKAFVDPIVVTGPKMPPLPTLRSLTDEEFEAKEKAYIAKCKEFQVEDWNDWQTSLIAQAEKLGVTAPSMSGLLAAVEARAGTLSAVILGVLPMPEGVTLYRGFFVEEDVPLSKLLEATVTRLNAVANELRVFLREPRPMLDSEIEAERKKAKQRGQKRKSGIVQRKGGRK